MRFEDELIDDRKGVERRFRRYHGLGIFCAVCRVGFEPDRSKISDYREKIDEASTQTKRERYRGKIEEEENKPREEFREHWEENHW